MSSVSSQLRCKAAVTFFHFCVVSNFWWLLVEALYLQTLLLCTFTHTTKLFWIYATVGWGTLCVCVHRSMLTVFVHLSDGELDVTGAPSATVVIWALLKSQLDDEG